MLKQLYLRFVYPNPSLHHKLLPTALFVRFFLEHVRDLPRQLLTVDLIRMLICLPRYLVLYVILRRKKFAPTITDGVSRDTIEHNMRGVGELAAPRSHLLIRPIVTIGSVSRNIRNLRVLSIGPRVEGEIYNLMGYGFSRKNIVGLDLFSYSPYIEVGDMHDMPFPDDHFDVVISGWVLNYSDTKQKAADEMARVTKLGGVIAIGNAHSTLSEEEVVKNVGRFIGSRQMLNDLTSIEELFGASHEDIFFRYDGAQDAINGAPMISVFRNMKKGASLQDPD